MEYCGVRDARGRGDIAGARVRVGEKKRHSRREGGTSEEGRETRNLYRGKDEGVVREEPL
eukprot:scaffold204860_cov29-Tisochrysis_lutea.AAC.2